MIQMTYKTSFLRIIIELVSVNLLILIGCILQNMSSYNSYVFTIIVNTLFIFYMLTKINTYKLTVSHKYLTAFNFKLGKSPEKLTIKINDASATYLYELAGRGIRQKKLKIYDNDVLKISLEPGLTGWSHSAIDKIAADLMTRGLTIKINED